jgi:hypothetical protein
LRICTLSEAQPCNEHRICTLKPVFDLTTPSEDCVLLKKTIPRYANIDSSSDHDIVYFCLLSLYASGLDDCLYWDKLRWNDITLANLLQWLE